MNTDSIHLILQARMGSTRRPGKSMADINGKPFMERVMFRLEKIFDGIKIMALPDSNRDDVLEALGKKRGWKIFRGSEEDVLERFAGTVKKFNVKKFIRICGDDPLVDSRAICGAAEALRSHKSCRTRNFPLGTGAEGAHSDILLTASAEAVDKSDREHVMPYIYRYPRRFDFLYVDAPFFESQPRLTADTEEDLEQFRKIFSALGDFPSLESVISFLGNKQ